MKNSITLEIGDQVNTGGITYTIIRRKGDRIVIQNHLYYEFSPREKWFLGWIYDNNFQVVKPKSRNFNNLYEKLNNP